MSKRIGSGILALFGLALFNVLGCSGGGSGAAVSGGTATGPTTPTPPSTDIYVAGRTVNAAGDLTATYWKNGVATVLGDPAATFSDLCCIAVAGNDVYIAGNERFGGHSVAVVWKNGVATRLSDGSSDATTHGIGLVGNDVYVAGTDGSYTNAVIWKNGQEQVLPNKGLGSRAYGVTIHNSHVYVVGSVNDSVGNREGNFPALWTDGVLSFPTGESTFGEVYCLVFYGADAYLGGDADLAQYSPVTPVYWKNGTLNPLAGSSNIGFVYALAVDGTDVYAGGNIQTPTRVAATVWKSGKAEDYSGDAIESSVGGLAFADGSFYAAGLSFPAAALWKDGVLTTLATSAPAVNHPKAFSMTVVTH